jgi:hypothetical protein
MQLPNERFKTMSDFAHQVILSICGVKFTEAANVVDEHKESTTN